jgi:hypothetical protein
MGLFGNSSAGIEADIGNYSTSLSNITLITFMAIS